MFEFCGAAFDLAWNSGLVVIALAALIMTGLGNPDFNSPVPARAAARKREV